MRIEIGRWFVGEHAIKADSGMRGPTGMYSWSTRFSFDSGIASIAGPMATEIARQLRMDTQRE
jgi:hypothetical protein